MAAVFRGLLAAAVALAGCSDRDTTTAPPPAAQNAQVNIGDNLFSPSQSNIVVGGQVNWTWQGSNQHNVTFDDGPASATQSSGSDYQRTFASAGTYTYYCTIHGRAIMSGTVIVTAL
jgi:plastocyanin